MLFFWRRIRKLLEKEDSQVKIGISNVYGANASVLDAFREAVTAIKSRIYKRESLIFAKEIKQEDFSEYYLEKEIDLHFSLIFPLSVWIARFPPVPFCV